MTNMLPAAVSPAAPPAPPPPAAAHPRSVAAGGDDATPPGFAQALDHAATAQPRAQTRDHGRGVARAPAGHGAAGRPDGETGAEGTLPGYGAETQSTPVEEAIDATRTARVDADTAGARRPPAPEGVGDLLAQLRSLVPVASGAGGADAAAQAGSVDTAAPSAPGRRASAAALAGARPGAAALTTDGAPGTHGRSAATGALRGNDDYAQLLAAAPAHQASAPADQAAPANLPALPAAAAGTPHHAMPALARLPATPGSADFGAQLAAQVTTYVRAGVQHARLQLNPAELGPVSVHIQLDGQTALVHLMAEHAQTRQALEQALPQLASCLRDAGLTLTGGGVFQQPRQGRDAADDASAAAAGAPLGQPGPAPDHGAAQAAPLRRRGVVDLVA